MIQDPVFLIGAERSGTTLLRLMLDHHPTIAFLPEFERVVELISDDGRWPPIDELIETLPYLWRFPPYGFEIDRSLDYPTLVDSFLRQKRDRAGKSIVGATLHRHFDRLLLIWPGARFIHIVRDPRDVAASCIGMGWAGNTWTGVRAWTEVERLWETFRERVHGRFIEVRYEELVSEPPRVLSQICRFLGVEFDPAMLSYADTTTYDRPDPSLAFQWRRRQSSRSVRLCEARAADMLLARGYDLSGLPVRPPSAMGRAWLGAHDTLARWRFRIRVYGVRLCVADFLARRLGLEPWRRRLHLRMEQIEATRAR
jgi:hypothetical protein